jgi:predicted dehydrogenase
MTGIGIIGCGYVADRYIYSLRGYPELAIIGVYDRDSSRLERFSTYHHLSKYDSLEHLLRDDRVSIVLNLTNPRSHFIISEQCLRAGKHVYSEKPLAMEVGQAKQLVALAASKNLWISSAPCSLLGETAQTIWRALREKQLGDVRVVYAEMDDGLLHLMPYDKWVNDSGAPWPYKDEFEVGCTLEHAGYYLTWLVAFFGPVQSMTAWASIQVSEKTNNVRLDAAAPDFSVACMQFESGVTARLTCSILAPHDHRLRIIGDRALLSTPDSWMFRSPVSIRRVMRLRRRQFYLPWGRRYPLVSGPRNSSVKYDWSRGVADLSDAIREGRKPRLAPDFCLHVNEIALGIHNAHRSPGTVPITTRFEPIDPMPWAR